METVKEYQHRIAVLGGKKLVELRGIGYMAKLGRRSAKKRYGKKSRGKNLDG